MPGLCSPSGAGSRTEGQGAMTGKRLTEPELADKAMWFAWLMTVVLRRHKDKPGWENDSIGALIRRLKEEVAELDAADNPRSIIDEAIDVANFCMMICDNLSNGKHHAEQHFQSKDRT